MSLATITRLRSGGAVFELGSMTHWFPDWRAAAAAADAHGIRWEWAPTVPHELVVTAVAPAMRVLS